VRKHDANFRLRFTIEAGEQQRIDAGESGSGAGWSGNKGAANASGGNPVSRRARRP